MVHQNWIISCQRLILSHRHSTENHSRVCIPTELIRRDTNLVDSLCVSGGRWYHLRFLCLVGWIHPNVELALGYSEMVHRPRLDFFMRCGSGHTWHLLDLRRHVVPIRQHYLVEHSYPYRCEWQWHHACRCIASCAHSLLQKWRSLDLGHNVRILLFFVH